MYILFRYPYPPFLHRELLDLGLDRVLLYPVILQFLIQCLHYKNDAPRREFVDSCDEHGNMRLWERVFRTKWGLFHYTRSARLQLVRSRVDVFRDSGYEERSIQSCRFRGWDICKWIYRARVV